MEEKRRVPRVNDKIMVAYKLPDGRNFEHEAITEDISEMGMQMQMSEAISVGQLINLTLDFLSDMIPFIVAGNVVWSKRVEEKDKVVYYSGVDFVDLDDQQKKRISGYIHRKLKLS